MILKHYDFLLFKKQGGPVQCRAVPCLEFTCRATNLRVVACHKFACHGVSYPFRVNTCRVIACHGRGVFFALRVNACQTDGESLASRAVS